MTPESIAHYKISSKLGEGAMGEVYRATDSKLGREVAIKLIPEDFARDATRMARFTREAQVLASLNHPNIAAIYGVEDRALIMELVEGQTLSERIKQGAIPIDEALDIARQIADGLEAAHNKGIVHRDLKPANIKITPGGTVKLLDFGLAKAEGPWSATTSVIATTIILAPTTAAPRACVSIPTTPPPATTGCSVRPATCAAAVPASALVILALARTVRRVSMRAWPASHQLIATTPIPAPTTAAIPATAAIR